MENKRPLRGNKVYKCDCGCKEGTQIPENMVLDKHGKPIEL